MTTLALRDTFAAASTGLITGHTADSGHTWANATSTGQSRPMSVGSTGGAFCADASTTDGFSAISSWTPPAANYGVAARCKFLDATTLEAGVGVRVSVTTGASGLLGYFGQMSTAASTYFIAKGLAGTFPTLASVAHTFTSGEQHDLYLTAVNNGTGGVDLVLYVDGVATVTYTDPASSSPILTAGAAALRGYSPSGTTTTGAHILWAQTDPQALTLTPPAPASGLVGTASGNWTVTPEVPIILATTATMADDHTATFAPTSLTFAAQSTAATFTLTPSVSGVHSVTATTAAPALTSAAATYSAGVVLSSSGAASTSLVGKALDSATLSSSGAASTSLTGKTLGNTALSSAGSASTSLAGKALDASVLTSAGSASTALAGSSLDASALASAGAASTSLTGKALDNAALSAAGLASTSLVGSSTSAGSATLAATGSASAALTGAALDASVLTSAGSASTALIGQALDAAALSSAGAASTALAGSALDAAALAAIGSASTTLAGSALDASALTAAGSAATALVGGSASTGSALAATGAASIALVGGSLDASALTATAAAATALVGSSASTGSATLGAAGAASVAFASPLPADLDAAIVARFAADPTLPTLAGAIHYGQAKDGATLPYIVFAEASTRVVGNAVGRYEQHHYRFNCFARTSTKAIAIGNAVIATYHLQPLAFDDGYLMSARWTGGATIPDHHRGVGGERTWNRTLWFTFTVGRQVP